MITTKGFQGISKALRTAHTTNKEENKPTKLWDIIRTEKDFYLVCEKVADYLQEQNPKFNRKKFLFACMEVE